MPGFKSEALREGLKVLADQNRGGRHDGRLLACEERCCDRPQRHLSLAEADIPDDEPVHGTTRGKIGKRLIDSASLIRS
jgi:hypothetical protein